MSVLNAYDLCYQYDLQTDEFKSVLDYALTKGRMLTVTANRPAADLARHVDEVRPAVVKVLAEAGGTARYIFPEWVISQVTANTPFTAESLGEVVEILTAETRQQGRPHVHEWLNLTQPHKVQCAGGPPGSVGSHPTYGTVPCWEHRPR